jgi:aspartate racemase
MKTIGLIGGMSWESTIPYYKIVNEVVKERLGGLHSAKVILYSVNFAEVERMQHNGDWDAAGRLLAVAASIWFSALVFLLTNAS